MKYNKYILILSLLGVTACAPQKSTSIPKEYNPFGEPIPTSTSPCKKLRESALTINYLDHTKMLVGCPNTATKSISTLTKELKGKVLSIENGITLLSIPIADSTLKEYTSLTHQGTITGNNIATHSFSGTAGQQATITLNTIDTFVMFNIVESTKNQTIFNGKSSQTPHMYMGQLPATGTYNIIIYQVGNAKDTGRTATYTINVRK